MTVLQAEIGGSWLSYIMIDLDEGPITLALLIDYCRWIRPSQLLINKSYVKTADKQMSVLDTDTTGDRVTKK